MQRRWTLKIHYILDQLLPPVFRDRGWFMKPLLRLALGDKAPIFYRFREHAHELTHAEFTACYRDTSGLLGRETDLNDSCTNRILREASRSPVLEVGCGTGYLAERLAARNLDVTAVDIAVSAGTARKDTPVRYLSASAEQLPFRDRSFDTVICTHTLEHVRNLAQAVSELRRVCRNRLIIVVPKQRPYKYTFDLHLHFFPYPFLLIQALQPQTGTYECVDLSGDLYYGESMSRA